MATFGAAAPAAGGANTMAAPTDHNVQSAGTDGISSLTWSPTANILVSTNWDGGVRCWEAQEQGGQSRALPKAQGELSQFLPCRLEGIAFIYFETRAQLAAL